MTNRRNTMKAKTQDRILFVVALLIASLLLLAPFAAGATGYPSPKPTPGAPIDITMMTNPVTGSAATSTGSGGAGGSSSSGNTYLLPAPAAAAPLPSGLCPMGDSESWSVVWGFVSFAKSSMRTEMACLDKLIAYGKETQPKPVQYVTNYISPPAVMPEPLKAVECVPPTPVVKKPTVKKPVAKKAPMVECKPAAK